MQNARVVSVVWRGPRGMSKPFGLITVGSLETGSGVTTRRKLLAAVGGGLFLEVDRPIGNRALVTRVWSEKGERKWLRK